MITKQYSVLLISFLLILMSVNKSPADEYKNLPYRVQSVVLLKTLAFNKNLSGNITLYVLDSEAFASVAKIAIGKKFGSARLYAVRSGESLPDTPPDIIYFEKKKHFSTVSAYTRKHNIMSITGNPDLVKQGVSIGVCAKKGKPTILLNLEASKQEKIIWHIAILKVAVQIK